MVFKQKGGQSLTIFDDIKFYKLFKEAMDQNLTNEDMADLLVKKGFIKENQKSYFINRMNLKFPARSNYLFDWAERDYKGINFKKIKEDTNSMLFTILKESVHLNMHRTIQINTFLLNRYIYFNYFPKPKEKMTDVTTLTPIALKNYERLSGIYIMMSMKYGGKSELSKQSTDIFMDRYRNKTSLLARFFFINLIPDDMEIQLMEQVLENFYKIDNFLPLLDFDPDFLKILESDAFKHLFEKYNPKYVLDEDFLLEYELNLYKKGKYYFNMNNSLSLSKDLVYIPEMHVIYCHLLGPENLIDEIISLFTGYYTKKIPSNQIEITNALLCFGILFKLTKGRLFCEIQWKDIKLKMQEIVPNDFVSSFLDQTIYERRNKKFHENYEDFDVKQFLEEYFHFLTYAGYYHFGKVRTGQFLIWRALINYLEKIQIHPEFRKQKGALLEKWCYDRATEIELVPEKLIFKNKLQNPSEIYFSMLEQTKSFPKTPIEIECEFPEEFRTISFFEIDLAIKIKNNLLLIECKGTSVPIEEEGNYFKWITRYLQNLKILKNKVKLILYLIDSKLPIHPYLKDIDECSFFIVQTEGIIDDKYSTSLSGFLGGLLTIKEKYLKH